MAGYEGIYEISDRGNVAVIRNGERFLRKPNKATSYLSFSCRQLPGQNRQMTYYVHTEVAKAFLGPRPEGMVIRHLDGDRYNNNASNLAYGYPVENVADDVKHGTHAGANNGRALFTEAGVRAVKLLLKKDVSLSEIARAVGCPPTTIWAIKSGKNWGDIELL